MSSWVTCTWISPVQVVGIATLQSHAKEISYQKVLSPMYCCDFRGMSQDRLCYRKQTMDSSSRIMRMTIEVIRLSPPEHPPLHLQGKVGRLAACRERGPKLLPIPASPD